MFICPKCNSEVIFRRNSVPRNEIYVNRIDRGRVRQMFMDEPKFYICVKCGHKFNVK